jgi:hypothetical protein
VIQEYFREGKAAFEAGKPIDSCTYHPASAAYDSWIKGWDHAWYEWKFGDKE